MPEHLIHTPGNWQAIKIVGEWQVTTDADPHFPLIAKVQRFGDVATANAHLIAASPDLLKVAKQQAAHYFRETKDGFMREGYICLECREEILGSKPEGLVHYEDCELAAAIKKAEVAHA